MGSRSLLIISGASAAIDVANGTSAPLVLDLLLKIFEFAFLFQLLLAVALLLVTIAFRPVRRRQPAATGVAVRSRQLGLQDQMSSPKGECRAS